MEPWKVRRKIIPLPGKMTASALAATTLDKAQQGEIKNLITIVTWKDGSISTGWSQMANSELSYASHVLSAEVNQILRDSWESD